MPYRLGIRFDSAAIKPKSAGQAIYSLVFRSFAPDDLGVFRLQHGKLQDGSLCLLVQTETQAALQNAYRTIKASTDPLLASVEKRFVRKEEYSSEDRFSRSIAVETDGHVSISDAIKKRLLPLAKNTAWEGLLQPEERLPVETSDKQPQLVPSFEEVVDLDRNTEPEQAKPDELEGQGEAVEPVELVEPNEPNEPNEAVQLSDPGELPPLELSPSTEMQTPQQEEESSETAPPAAVAYAYPAGSSPADSNLPSLELETARRVELSEDSEQAAPGLFLNRNVPDTRVAHAAYVEDLMKGGQALGALRLGWKSLRSNWSKLTLTTILMLALFTGLLAALAAFVKPTSISNSVPPSMSVDPRSWPKELLVSGGITLLVLWIQTLLVAGFFSATLHALRSHKVRISDLFNAFPRVVSITVTILVMGIVFALSAAILVYLPLLQENKVVVFLMKSGVAKAYAEHFNLIYHVLVFGVFSLTQIVIFTGFSQAILVAMDTSYSGISALLVSWRIMQGRKFSFVIFYILLGIVSSIVLGLLGGGAVLIGWLLQSHAGVPVAAPIWMGVSGILAILFIIPFMYCSWSAFYERAQIAYFSD